MRIVLVLFLIITAISFATPETDMNAIIDALYRADGELVYRGLSLENQASLSMILTMVQFAPDQVVEQFREELDVCISSSEVRDLTAASFIDLVINSPYFKDELPYSRDMIDCIDHVMQGDTAMVLIAIANEDSIYSHSMILQEGAWRIADDFFGNQ